MVILQNSRFIEIVFRSANSPVPVAQGRQDSGHPDVSGRQGDGAIHPANEALKTAQATVVVASMSCCALSERLAGGSKTTETVICKAPPNGKPQIAAGGTRAPFAARKRKGPPAAAP